MEVTPRDNVPIWALRDMVWQHCSEKDEIYDSAYLSSDAQAIRLLVHYGHMQLVTDSEGTRWVSAKFIAQERTPNAFGKDVIGYGE